MPFIKIGIVLIPPEIVNLQPRASWLSFVLAIHPLDISLSVTPDGVDFIFTQIWRKELLWITHSRVRSSSGLLCIVSTFTHVRRRWAWLIPNFNRRFHETMHRYHSFFFFDVHVDDAYDSRVPIHADMFMVEVPQRSLFCGSNVCTLAIASVA